MTVPEDPEPPARVRRSDGALPDAEELAVLAETATAELASGQSPLLDSWFAQADLPPPQLQGDPLREQIDHPRLQSLHDHWIALPRDGDLPHIRFLEPLRLRAWLGDLIVLDVLDEGRDFRYRVYGSLVASHVGFDLTGSLTSDIAGRMQTGAVIPLFFLSLYRRVVLDRCAWYSRHQPPHTVTAFFWRRLILPYVGDDGEVARLLIGILPSSRKGHTRQSVELGRRNK